MSRICCVGLKGLPLKNTYVCETKGVVKYHFIVRRVKYNVVRMAPFLAVEIVQAISQRIPCLFIECRHISLSLNRVCQLCILLVQSIYYPPIIQVDKLVHPKNETTPLSKSHHQSKKVEIFGTCSTSE